MRLQRECRSIHLPCQGFLQSRSNLAVNRVRDAQPSAMIIRAAKVRVLERQAAYGNRLVVSRHSPPVNMWNGPLFPIGVVHQTGPVEHRCAKRRSQSSLQAPHDQQPFSQFFLSQIGQIARVPLEAHYTPSDQRLLWGKNYPPPVSLVQQAVIGIIRTPGTDRTFHPAYNPSGARKAGWTVPPIVRKSAHRASRISTARGSALESGRTQEAAI